MYTDGTEAVAQATTKRPALFGQKVTVFSAVFVYRVCVFSVVSFSSAKSLHIFLCPDQFLHLVPNLAVVRVMVKFHSSTVVVDEASTSVQKIVGMPTDTVFLSQSLSAEIAVLLSLIQCHNALLAALKS